MDKKETSRHIDPLKSQRQEILDAYLARMSDLYPSHSYAIIETYAVCREMSLADYWAIRNLTEKSLTFATQVFTPESLQEANLRYEQILGEANQHFADYELVNNTRLRMQPQKALALMNRLNATRALLAEDIKQEKKAWMKDVDTREKESIGYRVAKALFGEDTADYLLRQRSRELLSEFSSPAIITTGQLRKLACSITLQDPTVTLGMLDSTADIVAQIFPAYTIDHQVLESVEMIIDQEIGIR